MKSLTDPTLLRRWLGKRLAFQIVESLLASFFALIGGAICLAVVFVIGCAIAAIGLHAVSAFMELFFNKHQTVSLPWMYCLSAAGILLLFLENFRIGNDYPGAHKLQNRGFPAFDLVSSLFSLLANADAAGKMTSDILLLGPRMTVWSVAALCQAFRLLFADTKTAAAALSILVQRLHRTSLTEMTRLLPGRDPMKALLALQEIDAILFLVREPAGVILRDETRAELNALLGTHAAYNFRAAPPEEEPEPEVEETVEGAEYYELLGVQPTASPEEIKAAYRSRIKQCHPDKFVDRGDEFRQLAEERAKALNEAYAMLMARCGEND